MLYEVDWAEDGTYRYGDYFSPEKFFNDCLENSNEFDLQLGYFSSATISVLSDGFASFISRGGRMRLIINHIVSQEDKEAINKGVNGGVIDCFDLSNFELLRQTFDEYQQQFFECLAFLINNKRIDIRIIRPRNKKGIAHIKSGQFRDGDSTTSFTGSANFTISGLFNNIEEIKIDRSDSVDRMVQKRIANQREEFDSIMSHRKRNIEYLSPDKLVSAIKSNYGNKDIEELLNVEQQLRKLKKQRGQEEREGATNKVCEDSFYDEPQFPYPTGPREYQKEAFENWKDKQQGLFAMATGTGKTLTALNCLLEIYKRKGYYKALILVPTITLVEQWEVECRKFRFVRIVKISSKNPSWREEIRRIRFDERQCFDDENISFIIIATYSSFARQNVFDILNDFSRNQMLLIADEAHNMGAPGILKKLGDIKYIRRIGLSATPERQFDEQTNKRLEHFFGVNGKYTYEYSMEEAIKNGVLCRYYYYPHIVQLTDEEMEQYAELSTKISRYFNFNSGTFEKADDVLTALLLARKRIIHKAANKLPMFRKIIAKRFDEHGSLKYTLVYVPEGSIPNDMRADIFDNRESISDDQDSIHLIDLYTRAVCDVDKYVTVRKFTGDTQDRDSVLGDFAAGRLQVLTSMKCLDEGVDVPRSELAIFCASTGNPRQFIQRRGRVLRTHKDKKYSYIHDLVVVPKVMPGTQSYRMEQSLLAGELKRVYDFSSMSENPSQAQMELLDVMNYYGLNLFDNTHITNDTER